MNAEIVTGYIGQVFDECEVNGKALSLLQELYDMASDEINSEGISESVSDSIYPSSLVTTSNMGREELIRTLKRYFVEDEITRILVSLRRNGDWTDGNIVVVCTDATKQIYTFITSALFMYNNQKSDN